LAGGGAEPIPSISSLYYVASTHMSQVDPEQLLQEISADEPSGPNLEYDPAFTEMERSSQGKPEQQMGNTLIPAEDPDWREVKSQALEILGRAHDMRVVAVLAKAALATEGWPGFRNALKVMKGYVDQYWATVHPQLDPDDDNDPTFRVNTLISLCDPGVTLRLCQMTPLVASRTVGRFSLRDMAIARGDLSAPEGTTAPTTGLIEAAFNEVPVEELQETHATLQELIELTRGLEASITDQVGAGNSVQLKPLVDILREAEKAVGEASGRRGALSPVDGGDIVSEEGGGGVVGGGAAPPSDRLSGRIRSRDDVLKAIEMICDYYQNVEPGSPVPVILRRAQRLATKSFLDIIKDILPDHAREAAGLGGPDDLRAFDEAANQY
jgi:type VI secretion system protein ImpA